MTRPRRSRLLAALVLGAALLAPAASAAPRPHSAPARPAVRQAGSLDLLARLWTSWTGLWSAEGCSLDPERTLQRRRGPSLVDNGCSLDPDGRCRAAAVPPTVDNGCSIDPSGIHCAAAPRATPGADAGCSLDPNGRCQ